jgi:signal peptidase II
MGTSSATAARERTSGSGWGKAAVVALAVLAIDQLSKALVRADVAPGESNELLPFLDIVHVHNDGVAFGFLGGGGALVLVVTCAALALLVGYFARHQDRPLLWLPTGLLLGGAVGNIVDRLHQGYVTDFVKFPHWPAFNVADMAITFGVIALVLVLERNARAAAA